MTIHSPIHGFLKRGVWQYRPTWNLLRGKKKMHKRHQLKRTLLYLLPLSAFSIMKSSLLNLVFMPMFFFYQISEAQVVSLTLNIADWTTVTETTTLSVLGACFSYRPYLTDDSSLAFCRRYRQLYSSSLEEKISTPHNNDAVLYNPSTVEKYVIYSDFLVLIYNALYSLYFQA